MNKPIKSTDPIKKPLVAAFKRLFKADKVTVVTQISDHMFEARCLKSIGNKQYEYLGVKRVIWLADDGDYTADALNVLEGINRTWDQPITLSDRDRDTLLDTVENPPEPNESLKALFNRRNK